MLGFSTHSWYVFTYLREHALELGIDPTFEVISETDANRLKELAFDQVIFEINQSGDTSLKQYIHSIGIFSYGGNSSNIQGYVDSLSNKALALPGGLILWIFLQLKVILQSFCVK